MVSECEGYVELQLFEDLFPQCGEELLACFCTWGEIFEQKKITFRFFKDDLTSLFLCGQFISVRKMTLICLRQFCIYL